MLSWRKNIKRVVAQAKINIGFTISLIPIPIELIAVASLVLVNFENVNITPKNIPIGIVCDNIGGK